ncbi:MAG: hypothetical protein ABIU95_15800, partial [Burkholderiales bacterium]
LLTRYRPVLRSGGTTKALTIFSAAADESKNCVHCHLLGTGDSGSGCTTHPFAHQWWHPIEVALRGEQRVLHPHFGL